MERELMKLIKDLIREKGGLKNDTTILYNDKRFRIKYEKKSYGGIVWIKDKQNDDPIKGMSMIIIEGDKIKFISNKELVEEIIDYLYF